MKCDLHTHSVYSDGTFTPGEIIAEAKKTGLGAIALTDHNTVSGVAEFMAEAEKAGITAVAGVELSTAHDDKEYHLLGLFISPEEYSAVEMLAKEFHVLKEISNIETIERLNEAGYMISYADVRKKNPTGNVNRAHIAAELMEKGYVKSVNEAFENLLYSGAGFYEPPARLMLMDAIRFLREIKVVPVIAHPLKDVDEATLRKLLPEAIGEGLMGIEVYHSDYDDELIRTAIKVAEDFGLLGSGGSDFHGANKPAISLGKGKGNLDISIDVYNELYEAHQKLISSGDELKE